MSTFLWIILGSTIGGLLSLTMVEHGGISTVVTMCVRGCTSAYRNSLRQVRGLSSDRGQSDPLDSLRCPNGCATRWLNYLHYSREAGDFDGWPEGEEWSQLRISEEIVHVEDSVEWVFFKLGLRCGNCGCRFGREVPEYVKRELDQLLEDVGHDLSDLAAEGELEREKIWEDLMANE